MRNTEILWSFPSLEPYLIIEPLSARGNVPNFPAEWSLVASSDYRSKRVYTARYRRTKEVEGEE